MQSTIAERVGAIRDWLDTNNYDAFIIPHEDEFLGEYLPARNERLLWATGFTGSAGFAVITKSNAAIFVDGRYTVQVTKQVPDSIFEYQHLIEKPLSEWTNQQSNKLEKIAFDPRLHTANWVKSSQDKFGDKTELCAIEENPIDTLWQRRPDPFASEVRLMELEQSGVSCETKRAAIAANLKQSGNDCAVLTQLDSICWLLNIRGLDVSRLPVLLSHAIVYSDSSLDFYFDSERLPNEFAEHVGNGVKVKSPAALQSDLSQLTGKTVLLDSSSTNAWFEIQLKQANAIIAQGEDPCIRTKAAKNESEAKGMRDCHVRDGVAMSKFLCWLDKEVAEGRLHNEAVLADKLEAFRKLDSTLVDLSFDTISAAGDNAAMCHYNHNDQPEPGVLTNNSLYLVDSGGQYYDGTTDITRTIAIGTPSTEMINQFTLVLKGHISLATAAFPKGTTGHQLDILARQHLWKSGYDYDHGTGHGVGHFLSVHEGPQRISKAPSSIALVPGMVVSNEPGYYRADGFGIRIENLEIVVEKQTQGDFPILTFESLTRCPIDKRNIDINMLSKPELRWLNEYHQKVWNDVSPFLEGEEKAWLKQATTAISHS